MNSNTLFEIKELTQELDSAIPNLINKDKQVTENAMSGQQPKASFLSKLFSMRKPTRELPNWEPFQKRYNLDTINKEVSNYLSFANDLNRYALYSAIIITKTSKDKGLLEKCNHIVSIVSKLNSDLK